MLIDFEIDDIDFSRADHLISDLFGMSKFSIAGEIDQIAHLINKHGIVVKESGDNIELIKWIATDPTDNVPPQFGSSAILAATKILLIRAFSDSTAVISFDKVFNAATPEATMRIIIEGSPYHTARRFDDHYVIRPDGATYDDVEAFQLIVQRTFELSSLGYIRILADHKSNDVGFDMFDYISFTDLSTVSG